MSAPSETMDVSSPSPSNPMDVSSPSPSNLPAPSLSLESLPDDVLRRIVDTVEEVLRPAPAASIVVGAPKLSPLTTAHVIAGVSRRLRTYIVSHFLPSIVSLGSQDWEILRANPDTPIAADAVVALLRRCTGLQFFTAENAKEGLITTEAVATMARASKETLETVDIKFIDLKDEAVQPLFFCPRLKRLEISFGRLTTSNLFHFDVDVTERIVAPLECLDVTWLPCVDLNAAERIAAMGTLTTLFLKNCENFDDDCAQALAAGAAAKSIVDLNLSYCPISNEALCDLIGAMPRLKIVKFAERVGAYHLPTAYDQDGMDAVKDRFREIDFTLDT